MKTFTTKQFLIGFLLAPVIIIPALALGDTTPSFLSDGLYGCNQTGAFSMSVGAMSAKGVYVPVNDAAVTLNTGYLVYKECVLRGVVDAEAHDATAGFVKMTLTDYMTANNGNPLFSQNLQSDQVSTGDDAFSKMMASDVFSNVNAYFQSKITTAIGTNYASITRQPGNALKCPYTGDLSSLYSGQTFSWDGLMAEGDPACNPMFAYEMANDQLMGNVTANTDNMMTRLDWGQGTYDQQTTDANGNKITTTPASIVNALTQQAVTSGFRQTENANDIGQMVTGLFAGIGGAVLQGGLSSVTQGVNGQASTLDQITTQSKTSLVQTAVNTAVQTLTGALATENAYYQALLNTGNTLATTLNTLRGTESSCWVLIENKVCTTDSNANAIISYTSGTPTCTDVKSGSTLHIATSTAFSDAAMAQTGVDLPTLSASIKTSQAEITSLTNFIASVSNTNSQDVQSTAMNQIDALVAAKTLHNQTDVDNANAQLAAVQQTTTNITTSIPTAWGGDYTNGTPPTYPSGTAWCNVRDTGLITYWEGMWK